MLSKVRSIYCFLSEPWYGHGCLCHFYFILRDVISIQSIRVPQALMEGIEMGSLV